MVVNRAAGWDSTESDEVLMLYKKASILGKKSCLRSISSKVRDWYGPAHIQVLRKRVAAFELLFFFNYTLVAIILSIKVLVWILLFSNFINGRSSNFEDAVHGRVLAGGVCLAEWADVHHRVLMDHASCLTSIPLPSSKRLTWKRVVSFMPWPRPYRV